MDLSYFFKESSVYLLALKNDAHKNTSDKNQKIKVIKALKLINKLLNLLCYNSL